MNFLKLTKYGNDHKITLSIHKYAENKNLCICMTDWYNGYPEPWSTLTVNLSVKCDPDCAFIDTNNNGTDIIHWLITNKLGDLTGQMMPSGFCLYPEFKFNLAKVKEYCDNE